MTKNASGVYTDCIDCSIDPQMYTCWEGESFDTILKAYSGTTDSVTVSSFSSNDTSKVTVSKSTGSQANYSYCRTITVKCKKAGETTITAKNSKGGTNTVRVIVSKK